ncbi:5012_t:CDS:2 [Paraglomus occultum]|uniref:5012_t:CDS:1 n=1 Tax=Paraglomus occultum TaxID=144539 RepID=A0A9N8ZTY9_9GLOM|nr:5012_t:CDS:2 [Paraglomus occultum]
MTKNSLAFSRDEAVIMDHVARATVNLAVLRRHDRNIVEIMDNSSHVVLYKFSNEQQCWTKKGVEGTMFVFKRCTQPVFGFVVMNRLGIDNVMLHLTDKMDIEFQDDYIIYRTDDDDIHGIWVYEAKDRERIGKLMMECCKLHKTIVPPPQLAQSPIILHENDSTSTNTNSQTGTTTSGKELLDALFASAAEGTQTSGQTPPINMKFNSSVTQAIHSIHTPQSASPPPGSVIPSSTSTTALNKSLLDLLCTPTKHGQSSQPQTSQPSTPFAVPSIDPKQTATPFAVSSSNQNYLIYSTLPSEGVFNGATITKAKLGGVSEYCYEDYG